MRDALSRYRPVFYRKAYQFVGNAADAEDVVQDGSVGIGAPESI